MELEEINKILAESEKGELHIAQLTKFAADAQENAKRVKELSEAKQKLEAEKQQLTGANAELRLANGKLLAGNAAPPAQNTNTAERDREIGDF